MIRKRIWELDALRGACIVCMVLIHLIWDLSALFGWIPGAAFLFLKQWGGGVFFLICGISCCLGSHPVFRGCLVFGCGLLCTAVTVGIYLLGLAGADLCIWFGTLHCLGTCMLLWPWLRKLPLPVSAALGLLFTCLGVALQLYPAAGPVWLLPLGFYPPDFATADYFPLLPYLGIFLLGTCLGRTVYKNKTGLFPDSVGAKAGFRFLCFCGRHALQIYLLHQPILAVGLFCICRLS